MPDPTPETRHSLAADLLPLCDARDRPGGYAATPVVADVTCPACASLVSVVAREVEAALQGERATVAHAVKTLTDRLDANPLTDHADEEQAR